MWTHLDATMEIEQRNWRDSEIVAHNRRVIVAHDHRVIMAINRPSPDQTARILREKSSLKTGVFSLSK